MSYPLPNFSINLTGQVAIVTGASAGLGRRFAKVIAVAGAHVALIARREDRLEELAHEIRSSGGIAKSFPADIVDAERLNAVIDDIVSTMGTPQILINNAGTPDAARAIGLTLDVIDKVIDTNLRAPFILSCEVARRLIKEKLPGRIVNISSSAAYLYKGNGSALYSITKAGLSRMVEALSVEWARHHINVTGIAPGAFSSEMMDGMLERMGPDLIDAYPRKRIGDPAHLDSTLLYLLSPSSEFVTGTIVHVDDGQILR